MLPRQLPEARLLVPNSGLFAIILNHRSEVIWQSESSLGVELDGLNRGLRGSESFVQQGESLSSPFLYSFSVSWETEDSYKHEFTLVMIEASDHFVAFVKEHRRKIILWLGLAGVILLAMQMLALNWSLSPLVRVSNELDMIEHARQDRIMGIYPREIAQLSKRINQFIGNERKNLTRYRNTLGDLAHSLKTPLAVLKGLAESDQQIDPVELTGYVDRMSNIVEYQLKRAASSRISLIHNKISIAEVLLRIEESLNKVYADKHIHCSGTVDPEAVFYGDEFDLYELLGNIMDNAYKWAATRIAYRTTPLSSDAGSIAGVKIIVEDDGPGVIDEIRELVLQRGVRADQQVDGQGIGLAVSREIIERYDGELDIGTSSFGGAAIIIKLPPALEG